MDSVTPEDELDENCLDLYIISDLVKKKKSRFTCLNSKFPWILEHNCYLVKYWESFMLIIVFYICIVYPYFLGIMRKVPGGFFFHVEIAIILSLVLNIIITCLTSVKTKKKYIRNFWNILNYRMSTLGFYLDAISIIPFEYIITIHTAAIYYDAYRDHLFYMCKGIKLVLVWRLSSFFEALERKLMLKSIIVKVDF